MFTYSIPRLSALVFALAIIVVGCKKTTPIDPEPLPTDQYTLLQSDTVSQYAVALYAEEALFVGYNQLFVQVTNASTGDNITDVTLHLMPMMDMGTMQHSAPTEQPGSANADGLYEGQVVFIMPSGDMGSWMVTVAIDNGNETIDVPMMVSVAEKDDPRMLTFLGDDAAQEKLFVSLIEPATWEVGINTFTVTVHRRETMMDFPPVEDLIVEITPEMPTMGHGSPNNVNPTHDALGHYTGEVNFTMTGFWRVHLTLKRGDDIVKEGVYFDITF